MAGPMKDSPSQPVSDTGNPRAPPFVPSHRASIVQPRHKSIISRNPPVMSNSQNVSPNGSQSYSSPGLDSQWRNQLWVEPADDVGPCCLAVWLPCVTYAQTAWKIKRGDGFKSVLTYSPRETAEQAASSRHSSIQQQPSNQASISQDSKSAAECGCNAYGLTFWISSWGPWSILSGETLFHLLMSFLVLNSSLRPSRL